MSQSTETKDLFTALAKAQSEISGAIKDSANPFFKSRYADLPSVWDAIRIPLTKNGLSVVQSTDLRDGTMGVVTTLGHSSGQWIQGFYPLNPVKNDPQGMGSAMTYARRYALAAMVGVVQIDDDGEAAMGRPVSQSQHISPHPAIKDPTLREPIAVIKPNAFQNGTHAKYSYAELGAAKVREWCDSAELRAAKDPKKAPAWLHGEITRAREWLLVAPDNEPSL